MVVGGKHKWIMDAPISLSHGLSETLINVEELVSSMRVEGLKQKTEYRTKKRGHDGDTDDRNRDMKGYRTSCHVLLEQWRVRSMGVGRRATVRFWGLADLEQAIPTVVSRRKNIRSNYTVDCGRKNVGMVVTEMSHQKNLLSKAVDQPDKGHQTIESHQTIDTILNRWISINFRYEIEFEWIIFLKNTTEIVLYIKKITTYYML